MKVPQALASLVQLFQLHTCLICNGSQITADGLCTHCSVELRFQSKYGEIAGSHHLYCLAYNKVTSKLILLAKEENLSAAREILADSISFSLKQLKIDSHKQVNLIPIPSRNSANRSRGFKHTELLVMRVCLKNQELQLRTLSLLELTGKVRDQSALNPLERASNLHLKARVRSRIRLPMPGEINILIDDLVTTGASAAEAIRAMSAVNLPIWGVISACATSPHSQ